MSTIDDLLFSPITKVDFNIRPNSHTRAYDWKPVSDRAHAWVRQFWPNAMIYVDQDGWLNNFCSDTIEKLREMAGQPNAIAFLWAVALVQGNYEFERIPDI